MLYHFLFQNVCNPFYEKVIKRRHILDHQKFLRQSQYWSNDEIMAFQWKELSKLIQHASSNVGYWKEKFNQLSLNPQDIISETDFRQLPITLKDDIRANRQSMIANNYAGKTWSKSTGGSTGKPLQFDYTPESYDWRVAISRRGYSWAGCEEGIKQAYIWGTQIGESGKKQKLKERLHHGILRQKYFDCFKFDEPAMHACLKTLNAFKPKVIIGYTNPLYNFAQFIEANGGLSFRPKAIISAAEQLHEYQRALFDRVFDCPSFNTYGSREFMLIASESEEHNGLHVSAENLYVEVIKADGQPAGPGETGELVITDLHNWGMPFLRYKIGDLAQVPQLSAYSKRGLPILNKIVGRSLDMLKTPEGNSIPGEFFPHLMKEFPGVKQFQVVQEKIDSLTIKIVRLDNLTETDIEFMNLEILFVDDIPLTATGKHRVTISKLQ